MAEYVGGRDHRVKCTQSRKSGTCMLQGYELKEFPIELLDPFAHLAGNELSQYVVMLKKLNLMDNEISVIPDTVGGIGPELAAMELRNNKIKVLPKALSALTGLKTLDVSNNCIERMEQLDLPLLFDLNLTKNRLTTMPSVSGLRGLAKLTLSDNLLTDLPASIGSVPSLRTLILDRNQLSSLPDFGGGCKLEVLSVAWNQLTSLPASLDGCKELIELDVGQNKITGWPRLPQGGKGLTRVVLSGNAVGVVPGDVLLALKDTLRELQVERCGLAECPDEVGALCKLKVLNIASNDMKDVPGCIGYLPELTTLKVEGNPIRRKKLDQPDCKSMLTYLRTKGEPHSILVGDSGGNPSEILLGKKLKEAAHYGTLNLDVPLKGAKKEETLDSFPAAVFEPAMADKLTELSVTGHMLLSVPAARLPELKKLLTLDLSRNRLGEMASSGSDGQQPLFVALASCPSIQVLKLRANGLRDVDVEGGAGAVDDLTFARGLGRCLKELDLSQNNLTSLPFSLILRAPKLAVLVAAYNQITGLEDDAPLLRLTSLYSVDLSHNRCTAFGQLRFMHSVSALNFDGNEIRVVPPELALMKSLKFLSLGQNPQRSIPGDVLGGGQTELLKFLLKRVPPDYVEPAWVGDVRSGKSAGAPAADDYGGGGGGPGGLQRSESGRMGARFFANKAGGARGSAAAEAPSGPAADPTALSADPHLTAELVKCEVAIADLEAKLGEARSAPVQHALKKQIAVQKANKGKIERKLKEKS